MKSKVSPLALGGVLALCAAILGFAWWTLTSTDSEQESIAEVESSVGAPTSGARVETAHPSKSIAAGDASTAGARVALADDAHPRALPQVEFELRSCSDLPLAGARTVLRRDEEVLGSKKCDASGMARFDAGDGRAKLIVIAKGIPAFVRDVSLTAGHQLIVLERGSAVSGRVRVAKEGSVADVELVLTSDRPLIDDSDWPEAVRSALELESRDKLQLVTHTNESGQFEFTGLGSPWSGKLEVGEAHELVAVSGTAWTQGADSIRLDDPVEGLVLDLAALERARGHVVASAGGPGIARASVSGFFSFESAAGAAESCTANFDGRTKSDGSFALPIHPRSGFDSKEMAKGSPWPALKSATLTLDGGEGIPRRRLDFSGAQLPESFDFGELVLARGSTLQFVTDDAQAQPVAGAVGRLDGERSEPTDETGHSSILYAPGTSRPLTVSLNGYRDAKLDVPKEVSDALRVVLTRTNCLTVIVHNPDDQPAVGIQVVVAGQRQGGQRGNGRNRANVQRTDAKGAACFSDITPAVPFTVTVRDAMSASVAERTVTLAADEWSTLEIPIPNALLSFSGVVRDEQGLALAEAGVDFTDMQGGNRASTSAHSDADGHFEFSGLSNPVGILRVRKSGFAPLSLPDFQIPPPGVLADIRLERGLRLSLHVVDPRGAPVYAENLRLELAGERPFQGRRTSDSEWEFTNLPHVGVTAIGTVGSHEYRHEVEPLNGNQEFLVPAQGGLEVTLRLNTSVLHSTVRIWVRSRDDRRVTPNQTMTAETLQTRTFAPLLPGEYLLSVSQFVPDDQHGNWITLGAVQHVTIAEGVNQRLGIER